MRFEYECPKCYNEMEGSFGDNVYCETCDVSYETDWDYTSGDSMGAWLSGKKYTGKVDIE